MVSTSQTTASKSFLEWKLWFRQLPLKIRARVTSGLEDLHVNEPWMILARIPEFQLYWRTPVLTKKIICPLNMQMCCLLLCFVLLWLYHQLLWIWMIHLTILLSVTSLFDPAPVKPWQSRMKTDSKDHGANMGPTWVLSAPDGPHVGLMNLAIREVCEAHAYFLGYTVLILKWGSKAGNLKVFLEAQSGATMPAVPL